MNSYLKLPISFSIFLKTSYERNTNRLKESKTTRIIPKINPRENFFHEQILPKQKELA